MCKQRIVKVNVTQMKDETVITYMNWNKKESTYINKICLKILKKIKLHQLSLSLKKKKKKLGLELYLEFGLRGFVSWLRRDFLLLFLRSPSHGRSSWGLLLFKALRHCPRLRSLRYFVRRGALWNFEFFGLLLLIGCEKILKLSILGWLGDWRGYFLLTRSRAWNSYGWREKDVFRPSQLGGSINPCSVECFFPSLSTVGSAYDGNLCP